MINFNLNNQQGSVIVKTVVITTSGVILVLVALLAFGAAKLQARDMQRVTDIEQIQAALKIFYDYNQRYPSANNGQPEDFIGKYLEFWPTSPKADGSCTEEANTYSYSQTDNGQSYILRFCLGKAAEDYASGYHQLKP